MNELIELQLVGGRFSVESVTIIRSDRGISQYRVILSVEVSEERLAKALQASPIGTVMIGGRPIGRLAHCVPVRQNGEISVAALPDEPFPDVHTDWLLRDLRMISPRPQLRYRRSWPPYTTLSSILTQCAAVLTPAIKKQLEQVKIGERHCILQNTTNHRFVMQCVQRAVEAHPDLFSDMPAVRCRLDGRWEIDVSPSQVALQEPHKIDLRKLGGFVKDSLPANTDECPPGVRTVIENRPFDMAQIDCWLAISPPFIVEAKAGMVRRVTDQFHQRPHKIEWTTELIYGDVFPAFFETELDWIAGVAVVEHDEPREPWAQIRLRDYEGQPLIWAKKTTSFPGLYGRFEADTVNWTWSGWLQDPVKIHSTDQPALPYETPYLELRQTLNASKLTAKLHGNLDVEGPKINIVGIDGAAIRGAKTGVKFSQKLEWEA